jgi:hypothetical protein
MGHFNAVFEQTCYLAQTVALDCAHHAVLASSAKTGMWYIDKPWHHNMLR